eukprot:gnl/MRDRNA2_/MRDRNA2_94593_c0_seq1.p1 gnl/MRDRNA2_/MRDRNA2_94593_c0~~gnl/MRDRNA2_/MRDRNA2_94593_c0_seq1.p1  ORF type:complete len:1066 (+),score=257.19 gnl/MRDRNA2_/MRDRNA2_94593_c0_seq1:116-3313(+)
MSKAQKSLSPRAPSSRPGTMSKSASSRKIQSAPSSEVVQAVSGRLVFAGAVQPALARQRTPPRALPVLTSMRGMQPRKEPNLHLGLRSALAQSSRPPGKYGSPRGDSQGKPPWNKRHHIIVRSNDRHARLQHLLQQLNSSAITKERRQSQDRANWMQPGGWYSKHQDQQQQDQAAFRSVLEDEDETEFDMAAYPSRNAEPRVLPVVQSRLPEYVLRGIADSTSYEGQSDQQKSKEEVSSRRNSGRNMSTLLEECDSSEASPKVAKHLDEFAHGSVLGDAKPSSSGASPLESPTSNGSALPELPHSALNEVSRGEAQQDDKLSVGPQVSQIEEMPASAETEAINPPASPSRGTCGTDEDFLAQEKAARDKCFVHFTEEESKVLRGFFDLHDADGSMSLSLAELTDVVDDIGRAPAEGSEDALEFERLMHKADSSGDGELNFQEFLHFLAEYYQSVYARLFVSNDEDRSGTISKFELKGLMVTLMDSGFKVRGEDIAELFSSIDCGGDGILDMEEFFNFMSGYRRLEYELLKESAGFPSKELEYLRTIYQQADSDGSGTLGIREVVELLERTMIGNKVEFQPEIDKIIELFARIDKDNTFSLDFLEFLRLLRVWSNNGGADGKRSGKKEILKVFKTADELAARNKAIDHSEANKTPKNCNLAVPDDLKKGPSLLERARTSMLTGSSGLDQAEAEKAFQENTKMEEELRNLAIETDVQDGMLATKTKLTVSEVRCLRESFEFCDADGSGYVDADELIVILKTLGCNPITPTQKTALAKTRECEEFKGELDFPTLVRFLVAYQKHLAEEVVLSMKGDGDDQGIPLEKLVQALYQIGQYLSKDGAIKLLQKVGGDPDSEHVSHQTFLKMVELDRKDKLDTWREKCGFSDAGLKAVKHAFSTQASRDDECIMNRDGRVLEALQLLNLTPPPEKREQLMRALLRVDRAGEGTISFHDFLLLVRQLENQKLYERTQKEKENIKTAGLDADAVAQFRQVFNDCGPNDQGLVGIPKIQQLFVDLGLVKKTSQRRQIADVIFAVTGIDEKSVAVSSMAFFQFVEVLHRLEKMNMGK